MGDIGSSIGLFSELIYNTRSINVNDNYISTYRVDFSSSVDNNFNQLLNSCSQKIFTIENSEEVGIPSNFINSNINITNNILTMDVTKYNQKYYGLCGF